MGLLYNKGKTTEFTLTQVTGGYYLTNQSGTWYGDYVWLNEPAQPFNISPFIVDFYNDNTKNEVPLFKTSDFTYSLKFYLQNDIITVKMLRAPGNEIEIYSVPVTGRSTPYNVYFMSGYNPNYEESQKSFLMIYGKRNKVFTVVGYSDRYSRTGLTGETGSAIDVGTLPNYPDTIAPPYQADITIIPRYYNAAGAEGFSCSIYASGETNIINLFNISPKNADNTDPEDITPAPPEPTPEEPFTPSTPEEYPTDPTHDDTSDTINIPGNPTTGVSTTGMIHVYKITTNDLDNLGEILFPDMGLPTDIVDAVTKLYNVIANSNLINFVVDCHMIPVSPQIGSNANIKVGPKTTNISVPKVTSDYIDATCGSLNIAEWFQGYQDYSLTKARLYLPFIGFVDVKPEFWQSGTISVDYKFNIIDGSFMCYIRSVSSKSNLNGSVIAQYGGNACMHFPITGVNYANMVSGVLGAATQVLTGQGSASSIAGGAMSALNTVIQKGEVQQSNGYNSTSALLGVREAYLMIERPVPAFPAYYGHDKGYPANITTALTNVTGFTIIEDIDLSGIPLTQEELEELRGLLKEGVYF